MESQSKPRHKSQSRSKRKPQRLNSEVKNGGSWSDSGSENAHRRHGKEPHVEFAPPPNPSNETYASRMANGNDRSGLSSSSFYGENPFIMAHQPESSQARAQPSSTYYHNAALVPWQPGYYGYPHMPFHPLNNPAQYSNRAPTANGIPTANVYSNSHFHPPPYPPSTYTQPPKPYPNPERGYYNSGNYLHTQPPPAPLYPNALNTVPEPLYNYSEPEYMHEPQMPVNIQNNVMRKRSLRGTARSIKKKKEAAESRETKNQINKLQKLVTKVESALSHFQQLNTQSDLGRLRSEYPLRRELAPRRHTLDGRKGGELEQLLEDLVFLMDENRRHEDRGYYGGLMTDGLRAPIGNRLELERRALLVPRDQRDLRSMVEEIVVEIFDLQGKDDRLPRRSPFGEDPPGEYQAGSRVPRDFTPDGVPVGTTKPRRSSGRSSHDIRYRHLSSDSGPRPTQHQQPTPVSSSQGMGQAHYSPSDVRAAPLRTRRSGEHLGSQHRDDLGRRRDRPGVGRPGGAETESRQGRHQNLGVNGTHEMEEDLESDYPEESFPPRRQNPYRLPRGHPDSENGFRVDGGTNRHK